MPSYRPEFATHVIGIYPERKFDRETGEWEVQRVLMHCEKCGGRWQRDCNTGNVRSHIIKFAIQHVHKDPLAP